MVTITQQWEIDNYLAFVRTVMIIYYYFTDKEINPDDYREELIHIYKAKEWSPYIMNNMDSGTMGWTMSKGH